MSNYVRSVDIAKALNLSPSTVSRALNDHYSISLGTKIKVHKLASKLGYQINLHASSLINKKTNLIGLVIPDVTSYFLNTVIKGIRGVLEPQRYNLVIMQSGENYATEMENLRYLCAIRVEGMLYSPTIETSTTKHLKSYITNKVPFVNFDRACKSNDFIKVLSDDEDGAFCAVQHLIDIGCKRIAHISGPKTAINAQNRLNGYIRALRSNGMEISEELVIYADFSIENSIGHIKKLMELSPGPDGIFAVNDAIALGCISVIKGKGLNIPNDIALVGYDDETYSQYLTPSLTTIRNPIFEMGQLSAQICLDQINIRNLSEQKTRVLKPQLIMRDSSKKGRALHYAQSPSSLHFNRLLSHH